MGAPKEPHCTVTMETIGMSSSSISEDHDIKYGVPTLSELGQFIFLFQNKNEFQALESESESEQDSVLS